MQAVIFTNGVLAASTDTTALIQPDDLIIAVDGGAHHLEKRAISPHVVVGDLDSVSPDRLEALAKTHTKIVRHPVRKDQTDLELALTYALGRGVEQMIILGALGGRWDMTFANIMLAVKPEFAGAAIRFVDGNQEISLIRGGGRCCFIGRKTDILSLIPLGGDALGVTASGVEYPLNGDILHFGATRGISNVLAKGTATVGLETGLLLCVHIRG